MRYDIQNRYDIERPEYEISLNDYRSKVKELAQRVAEGVDDPQELPQVFPQFVRLARRELPRPQSDLRTLDILFNDYLDICTMYRYIPSIYSFAELVGIDDTLRHWIYDIRYDIEYSTDNNGNTITLSRREAVKRWRDKCGAFLVNVLANTPGASVNRIFIAKSVYGLRDDGPAETGDGSTAAVDVSALPELGQNA